MSSDVRRVMLSLDIDAKVKSAQQGMDQVADSAANMARSVDESHDRLLRVADGADSVATNFSTLAGAAGDIAGGLDMVGLGQFSDELEGVAPALMLVAGLADVTAVATNALSAANLKARASTIAKTVSEKASAAATKASAAAQWLFNAALSANPIGLVIVAVVALVAAVVIAYKKSERFRAIVQAVGRVGAKAIGWVVDKVGDLVGWLRDKIPPAFTKAKDLAVRAFLLITTPQRKVIGFVVDLVGWVKDKVPAAFGKAKDLAVRYLTLITTPQRKIIDLAGDVVGLVRDKVPDAFRAAKDTATDVLSKITAPIRGLVDWVNDLIDAISHIHWPEPPGWVKDLGDKIGGILGRTTMDLGGRTTTSSTTSDRRPTVVINVSGALDPEATARQIEKLLAGRLRLIGGAA